MPTLPRAARRGRYDALFEAIGGARLVLIGEASHGTHDFYEVRAELTKRLIGMHASADAVIRYLERVTRKPRGGRPTGGSVSKVNVLPGPTQELQV